MSELDKGKATITGAYFRLNKTVTEDFTIKCIKSSVEPKKGQSKKEIITEMLMAEYEKRGDNIFYVLNTNPF